MLLHGGSVFQYKAGVGDCEVEGNCCCTGTSFFHTCLGLGIVTSRVIAAVFVFFTRLGWGIVKSKVICRLLLLYVFLLNTRLGWVSVKSKIVSAA